MQNKDGDKPNLVGRRRLEQVAGILSEQAVLTGQCQALVRTGTGQGQRLLFVPLVGTEEVLVRKRRRKQVALVGKRRREQSLQVATRPRREGTAPEGNELRREGTSPC